MPNDECHYHERWGTINISTCDDTIRSSNSAPRRFPIDGRIKQNIAGYEFVQAVVDAMTVQRREDPILSSSLSTARTSSTEPIALRRRIQDGCADVAAYVMTPEAMRDMRVRLLRLRPDGVWEQDGGPTDEELEREVQEAKRMVARIFQRPPEEVARTGGR